MADKKIILEKENLILCEGQDDLRFLVEFLQFHIREFDRQQFNEFQVISYGGKDKLRAFIASLKNLDGFSNVKSLLVFRDIDESLQGAMDQIKDSLRANHFSCPSYPFRICKPSERCESVRVGYGFFPCFSESEGFCDLGALEDQCLAILNGENVDSVLRHVNLAYERLNEELRFRNPQKNLLHAYFSFTNEFVGMKIGEAAKAGAFSYGNEKMANVLNLMLRVFRDGE